MRKVGNRILPMPQVKHVLYVVLDLSQSSHAVTDQLQKLSPIYVIFEKYFKENKICYREGWNDVLMTFSLFKSLKIHLL